MVDVLHKDYDISLVVGNWLQVVKEVECDNGEEPALAKSGA